MQNGGGIEVDPTVPEGGTIVIRVSSNVSEIYVWVTGRGTTAVPVTGGIAEFQVSPDIPGGTPIVVSDCKVPAPSSATVTVIGSESS